MSFQTIVNNATNISVDVNPISGAVISRSNRLKTAQRGQPIYKFEVIVGRPFEYNGANRAMLQVLQTLGRTTEQEITLSSTTGMGYIMGYAGTVAAVELAKFDIASFTGSQFVIDTNGATISAGDTIFEVGDYIQPANSRYTYQVKTVVFGSDVITGQFTVELNRLVLPATSDGGVNIVGQSLNIANNCTFHVKCMKMPKHTLQPGKIFTFEGGFEFIEVIL
jgi:hypothetical protein|tara:strand:+ start:53 stop:718 length:666 start_codon:yes stop_codon:yes gene_type:complete